MKKLSLFLVPILLLISCGKEEKEVEIFSEAKPYTLEIKQERSFYQAEKIVSRLDRMGIGAYILKDSTEDGEWYQVVSGALIDTVAIEQHQHLLDSAYQLKAEKVINFKELDSIARLPIKSVENETRRIDSNEPDVPAEIMQVIKQYPQNDMFYLQNISLLKLTHRGIKMTSGNKVDMPRGVSLYFLKDENCTAFASVIYEDNLYGDNVTLQVVKCGADTIQEVQAAVVPKMTPANEQAVMLCAKISDKILDTGTYQDETKAPIEIQASTLLSGFTVSFTTKKEVNRKYFILTDEKGEYIYMAQSTKKTDEEMVEFLSEIGKSEGLKEYDEFYNSFYTLPDKNLEGDEFLGYYVEKVGWNYAKMKNYQKWAKLTVGHWLSSFYFYNERKSYWSYGIFDFLTNEKRETRDKYYYNKQRHFRTIYGVRGSAVYYDSWWYGKYLTEVNFSIGRYAVYVAPYDSSLRYFGEKDLINRAEQVQFNKGGYHPEVKPETSKDKESANK